LEPELSTLLGGFAEIGLHEMRELISESLLEGWPFKRLRRCCQT